MDGERHIDFRAAPLRDARYAKRQLIVEPRADGGLVLTNPMPVDAPWDTAFAPLAHWGVEKAGVDWLSERAGQGWRTVTFGEALAMASAAAGGLAALRLPRGTPLLILARNGIDHALMTYAAIGQGLPVAPVSPQYGLAGADLGRLAHAVEVLQPGAVYVDDAAAFAGALEAPFLAGLPVIASRNARPGDIAFETLLKSPPAAPIAKGDDPAKYMLTSGSTGRPKAVIYLNKGMAYNAAQVAACFDDPDPPVVVNSAPWSHTLGANAILHMVLHRGGRHYIDAGTPTASGFAETLRNLHEIPTTYHNMVPAGWILLAEALDRDPALCEVFFRDVRVLQYGGAALGQGVVDRIQAAAVRTIGRQITFGSGYGATETGPTACNVHWENTRAGMAGLPVPQTSVRLAPVGEKLEIRVKGPQVTPGYLRAPEATAAAFDDEGFYRLGDAVKLADADDPTQGLVFDGRLSENFKLVTGTFVSAGALRIAVITACGGAISDAVVCGEGQEGVGLLVFLNEPYGRALADGAEDWRDWPAVHEAVRAGIARHNAGASGGAKIARVLIQPDVPHAPSGEVTDKGYINQALARTRRAADVERLFAPQPDAAVMVF